MQKGVTYFEIIKNPQIGSHN